MIYDLFHFYTQNHASTFATDRSYVYRKELVALLESGRSKAYREVSYYAGQLSVQIADEMNFTSLSYFSRYVTKHLGMSPKAYREAAIPK